MADFGYGVCLDDVMVMDAPTCPAPTDQTVTHVTSAGATMGWTGAESFFDVFWFVQQNEYVINSPLGPTAYIWGYLASRK